MNEALAALVIDDDAGDRKLVSRHLAKCTERIETTEASSAAASRELHGQTYNIIFCDNHMSGKNGMALLPFLRDTWPDAAIILVTGQGDEVIAKNAIISGATDYIAKGALNQNAVLRMVTNGVRTARKLWRLEEQRRDLSLFADVIVHDFKAPIRGMSFLAEQVAEDLEDGQYEEVRLGVAQIGKSAVQMSTMIESLAEHVRLDRETEFGPHLARNLVNAALDILSADLDRSTAEVVVEVASDLPSILCDGPKIVQVLQNLIANSIKYAGDHPLRIEIGVSRGDEKFARFYVSDNGIGIPEEYRGKVFDPFKRVPGRTDINGSGLGLATCKKNINRHGGTICCSNSRLGGAEIQFLIPLQRI